MFIIGLELDTVLIRKSGHSTIAISHASIIVPFLLGSALALFIYPLVSTRAVPFTTTQCSARWKWLCNDN